MNLALFDFDGTITTHDSFRDFLIFICGRAGFVKRILPVSPWLAGFVLRLVSRENAKKKVSAAFLAGMPVEKFNEHAGQFCRHRLTRIIRPDAMEKIRWHKENGDRVVVVSASFSDYLKFWCQQLDVELISTRLEEKNGILTGNFVTPNCWGPEKVRRIKEQIDLSHYATIYAYGDSRGDREMLAIANQPGYRVFVGR